MDKHAKLVMNDITSSPGFVGRVVDDARESATCACGGGMGMPEDDLDVTVEFEFDVRFQLGVSLDNPR